MPGETAIQLRIHGRVQGVWFRAWAEREANDLNLRGWVRNRRDGSVEALAIGRLADLEEFKRRCRDGPPLAQVDAIEETPARDDGSAGFRTTHTE